jgi:hypothetical protein
MFKKKYLVPSQDVGRHSHAVINSCNTGEYTTIPTVMMKGLGLIVKTTVH